MTLVFLLALAFAGPRDTVVLDGHRWQSLLDPIEEEEDAPGPVVIHREVSLEPVVDGDQSEVRFLASWRIRASEAGWFEQRLTGPGVQVSAATWRGREVPLLETVDGVKVAIPINGQGVLAIRGVVVGDPHRAPVRLDLMPAGVGRVRVRTDEEAKITAAGPVVRLGGTTWTGAAGLALQLTEPAPPAVRPDLATATAAVGITVGEGSYAARGRVRWEVRHGELTEVSIDGSGLGADLELTGPTVASWSRSGDRIDVVLREPEEQLVELELTWSGSVPSGDEATMTLPQLKPRGAFRTQSAVQLARDGEIEMVPRLESWDAVPFSQLPEWGRGLVEGSATATFTAAGTPGAQVGLFRFTPVTAPPTFVDKATITAAMTAEGNVLMRAHYAVRNDRSAHLRLTPPEGALVVGARVAGETAQVARDGRTWLLPLEKSVETVEGLLSFPVEVTLLLRGEDWNRKELRALPLPRVDAPIAVTRATLHLPPGYENRLEDGEGDVVGGFTEGEGIAYGKGSGSSAQAEALMQEAVQAWMGNSFDEAEDILRELEDIGGFDENAQRLQSNLDVISGKGEGQYDVALERRVKEQAKARSLEDQKRQEEALKVAEENYYRGDYAVAEKQYKKALELGQKLDKLEQSESVEYEARNAEVVSQLEDVAKQKSEAKAFKAVTKNVPGKPALTPSPSPKPASVNKRISGASSNENLYVLDGANITDVSAGASGVVLSKDSIETVPTGRSYQTTVTGTTESTGEETVTFDFDGEGWADEPIEGEPEPEPEMDEDYGDGLDDDFAYDVQPASEDVMLAERRGPRLHIPKIPKIQVGGGKGGGRSMDAPPPPPDAQTRDERKPAVAAVQLTTVIPTQGQAVLYEHLLLDAGAEHALPIEAILPRRNR